MDEIWLTRPSARGKASERPPCTRHPNPTVPLVLLPRAHPRPLCSSAFAAQRGHARLAPQRHPPGRPHSSLTAPLTLPVAVFTARDDSTPAFRAACVRMEQLHLWHRRLGRLAQRSTLPSRFWSSRRALQLLHESPVRVSGRNHRGPRWSVSLRRTRDHTIAHSSIPT